MKNAMWQFFYASELLFKRAPGHFFTFFVDKMHINCRLQFWSLVGMAMGDEIMVMGWGVLSVEVAVLLSA